MYSFQNDYSEGAHPNILRALETINYHQNNSYGLDEHCDNARDKIQESVEVDALGFLRCVRFDVSGNRYHAGKNKYRAHRSQEGHRDYRGFKHAEMVNVQSGHNLSQHQKNHGLHASQLWQAQNAEDNDDVSADSARPDPPRLFGNGPQRNVQITLKHQQYAAGENHRQNECRTAWQERRAQALA